MIDNIIRNKEMWGNPDNWVDEGHEWSNIFETTDKLWNEFLFPRICMGLKGDVLEIAPGYGRITERLLMSDIKLSIIDINENCIEHCYKKFGQKIYKYHLGDGDNLKQFVSNSKDFVISFDSFVHMSEEVINGYLGEIHRVLKNGGYAWIHHSNLYGGNEDNFKNWGGRSNMTKETFKNIAEQQGLKVIHQEYVKWENTLDVITTLQK